VALKSDAAAEKSKINFREISRVVRFSTLQQYRLLFGHGAMSELSPLSDVMRKSDFGAVRSPFDPN
jgi:hypothetical protein